MFYFQLVIMAGTVLLAYYFEYTDTFPVHIQGFFCYDKTFSKPYPGPDDTSKIPPVLIYSLVTAIPTLTVRVRCIYKCGSKGQKIKRGMFEVDEKSMSCKWVCVYCMLRKGKMERGLIKSKKLSKFCVQIVFCICFHML